MHQKTSLTPRISLVIPFKDEAENLPILFDRIGRVFCDTEIELLLVDDASIDSSGRIAENYVLQSGWGKYILLEKNRGKSTALAAGFQYATGDVIAILDADLQNDPRDLPPLIRKMKNGYDLVIGVRQNRKDNALRRICSKLGNQIRNRVLGDGIQDSGCGMIIFRRQCLSYIPLFDGFHRFLPALFLMNGFTAAQKGIRHYPRKFGKSKYGLRNRLFVTLFDLIGVKWLSSRTLGINIKNQIPKNPTFPGNSSSGSGRFFH